MKRLFEKRKRIKDGRWIEGYLIYSFTGIPYIVTEYDHIFGLMKIDEVDPDTICKCKDKNGKLIWENDIVSCEHEKRIGTDILDSKIHKYTRNYAIEFENTFCNYGLRFINKSIHFRCTQATLCMHDCEVLGNVFDNPELLEV